MLALQNFTWGLEVPNATRESSHPLGVNTNLLSKVLITVLYILIFLVGTTGNVLTIQLVLKKQSLHSLQGTVHYHLVSLALSDILILVISIPIELYNFIWFHYPWVFGDAVCRGYYFLRDICSYATVLNIASLSCERYLAICHPMRAKRVMSKMRTKKILAAIWVSSLIFALPMAFIMGIKYENMSPEGEPDPSSLICTSLVSTATLKIFIQVNAFVSFVLPVMLIGGLNCITVSHLVSLRSRSSLIVHSSCKSPRASKELRKSQSSPSNLSRIPIGGTSWKKNLTVSSEPNRIQSLQHSIYMLNEKPSVCSSRPSPPNTYLSHRGGSGLSCAKSLHRAGAIVIAYIVCWLPYHARRLMFCYIPDDEWSGSLYTFYHYFYMLTNTLFYISSAVNPVLYNVVSSSFRKLFLETLSPSCSKQNSNFSIKSSSSHIRPD